MSDARFTELRTAAKLGVNSTSSPRAKSFFNQALTRAMMCQFLERPATRRMAEAEVVYKAGVKSLRRALREASA